ncbi:hypothetical protein M9458_041468, partial [Cirrhinus mrigala]
GHVGYHFNSCHHWLVQFFGLKDLHFCFGHGWAAAVGGVSLRPAVWSLCPHLCFLNSQPLLMDK